ncbi:MAG: TIGR04086 family membrane protein [Chloroflexota bacterium]|nr:TIGR04086 family membrane protein [Chloroflexota bacterium]
MNTKPKLAAIIIGALVTLTVGGIAFAILRLCYPHNVPQLAVIIAPFLCSLIGGYAATRMAQVRGLVAGALSGLVVGIMIVSLAMLFTGPNTALAAVLLAIVLVIGGAMGGWLTRVRLSLEK